MVCLEALSKGANPKSSRMSRGLRFIFLINFKYVPSSLAVRNVITKPFHHTQKILAKSSEGIAVTIEVILNYELEREILGFGECITVIKPKKLRERIESKLKKAVANYLSAGTDPE
jgi:predicted DNA-binding transcriptional regulator YafY